jgi:DsbC/DsbD-like thiol-disulfide interchange protein
VPLSITVAPLPGVLVGTPQWPTPRPLRVEGLEEQFLVYTGKVSIALPLSFTEEGDDLRVQVTVGYQTCSDTDCYAPGTVVLELPVQADDLVERPRRR